MNKKITLNLILVAVIAFCGFKVLEKNNQYKKSEASMSQVRTIKESADTSIESQNEDYRFWINIDNTKIDYPVVQGNDNEFYLKHDFFKKENIAGSIFMDYRVNETSKNKVIYGHNMKNGSMFKDVELFKDENFFNQNEFIKINKNGKEYTYKVFSVYYTSGENTDYLQTDFSNDTEFNKFLETASNKSLFQSNHKLNNKEIITLSTCSYEGDNFRTVVHAQLVK